MQILRQSCVTWRGFLSTNPQLKKNVLKKISWTDPRKNYGKTTVEKKNIHSKKIYNPSNNSNNSTTQLKNKILIE